MMSGEGQHTKVAAPRGLLQIRAELMAAAETGDLERRDALMAELRASADAARTDTGGGLRA